MSDFVSDQSAIFQEIKEIKHKKCFALNSTFAVIHITCIILFDFKLKTTIDIQH